MRQLLTFCLVALPVMLVLAASVVAMQRTGQKLRADVYELLDEGEFAVFKGERRTIRIRRSSVVGIGEYTEAGLLDGVIVYFGGREFRLDTLDEQRGAVVAHLIRD